MRSVLLVGVCAVAGVAGACYEEPDSTPDPCTPTARVVATFPGPVGDLAVDATHAYVRVYREDACDISAPAPEYPVVSEVWRAATDRAAPPERVVKCLRDSDGLVLDAEHLYWTGRSCKHVLPCWIDQYGKSDGRFVRSFELCRVGTWGALGGHVFAFPWAERELWRWDASTGDLVSVHGTPTQNWGGAAMWTADEVFFTDDGAYGVRLDGDGAARVLADAVPGPFQAANSTALFGTTEAGEVWSLSRAGGAVSPLAADLAQPRIVDADDDTVVVQEPGRLVRLDARTGELRCVPWQGSDISWRVASGGVLFGTASGTASGTVTLWALGDPRGGGTHE